MQKTKRLYIILIFLIVTLICGVFCVNNNYIVKAEEIGEDVEFKDEDKTPPTPWTGEVLPYELQNTALPNGENNPYIIDSAEKLAYLAFAVDHGYTYRGTYFKQTNNLDLGGQKENDVISGLNWKSIGYYSVSKSAKFCGIYDGGGYSIINMASNGTSTSSYSYGLFGYTDGAHIKNVNLTSFIKISGSNVACLVGYAVDTKITDCNIFGDITGTITNVGMLVGTLNANNNLLINNNDIYGQINANTSSYNVGGVFGCVNNLDSANNNSTITISNIETNTQITSNTATGGICCISSGVVTFENCINKGAITVTNSNNVGGIVAINSAIIKGCKNYATISVTGNNVGGIAGQSTKLISNCINYVAVTGRDYVGGIVGSAKEEVSDCANRGLVTGNNDVGGIAGIVSANNNSTKFYFQKNYNLAIIKGNEYVAGLAGELKNVEMRYCFVFDNEDTEEKDYIQGNNYVAGLVANMDNANVFCCYANTLVKSQNVAGGLIATYIGAPTRSRINAFYFIGEVVGLKVAGIIQSASNIDMSYGYSVAKLSASSEAITSSESGAVVGKSIDSIYNRVYFNKEYYSIGCGNENYETIVPSTTNELIYGAFTEADKGYFEFYTDSSLDIEYYYDYYPVLTSMYFGMWFEDSDNYFINHSTVGSYTTKSAIAKVYNTVRVTFYTNCDTVLEPIYVKQNVDMTNLVPHTLTKEGFVFAGWYVDKDMAIKFNPSKGLSQSTRLYARFDYPETTFPWWIFIVIIAVAVSALAIVYLVIMQNKTIKFKVDGLEIADMKVKVGAELKLPKPKKSGYKFKGWYYNEDLTKKFDLETMPNINLILFGSFTKVEKENKDNTKTTKKSTKNTSKKSTNNKNNTSTSKVDNNNIKE